MPLTPNIRYDLLSRVCWPLVGNNLPDLVKNQEKGNRHLAACFIKDYFKEEEESSWKLPRGPSTQKSLCRSASLSPTWKETITMCSQTPAVTLRDVSSSYPKKKNQKKKDMDILETAREQMSWIGKTILPMIYVLLFPDALFCFWFSE